MIVPRRGFGQVSPGQVASVGGGALNIANLAQSGAPTSTQIEGSIGSGLMTAGALTPPPVGPVLMVAGLVSDMLAAFGVGSGCGQTCVLSSRYADAAESLLRQNLQTYFAQANRNTEAKALALANFDAIWNDLHQACSNPALGDAGKRCISDRQAGACVWRQTPEGYAGAQYAGEPQPGECWNWFSGYRDPIANDPAVSPLSQISQLFGGTVAGTDGASAAPFSPLLLLALMGLAAVWVVMS